jgi:hypothetical protein
VLHLGTRIFPEARDPDGSRTPMKTMKDWHQSHPQLFVKSPRNHAGRDT